jgi:beta-mannosidase
LLLSRPYLLHDFFVQAASGLRTTPQSQNARAFNLMVSAGSSAARRQHPKAKSHEERKMIEYRLDHYWQVKQRDPTRVIQEDFLAGDWLPAVVPGTVHEALLEAKLIPDPLVDLNELAVQWVGETDWLYRSSFTVTPEMLNLEHADLCFDGLDTFAQVWLNGTPILTSDNMFIAHQLDVRTLLKLGQNEIHILFDSALRRGRELEALMGRRTQWNAGDHSRPYVRKAQYHYSWDWGPTVLTAGLWRGVRLECYDAWIDDVAAHVTLSEGLSAASIECTVAIAGSFTGANLRLELLDPEGLLLGEANVTLESTNAQHRFDLEQIRLWCVAGHGEQPLYRLEVRLEIAGREIDRHTKRIGLRRIRLRQEPIRDELGSSFTFEVNGVELFVGGANWIPDDSFTSRTTPERYRQLVQLTRDANMTMLRVWGGGIYEADAFYNACDELGILVWQDFMFACAMYPAHDDFLTSVRLEAEQAVRRLRHHACLALWCGNNEDYMHSFGEGKYDASQTTDLQHSIFPAREIYERVLPEVCARLDPQTRYWEGSPYGGTDPNDATVGDRHTWDVWHIHAAPYQDYPKFEGRFVSEFGMAAPPHIRTIEAFTAPLERHPLSRTMEFHHKAGGGSRRVALYLSDNMRPQSTLTGYIYAAQLVQAEALASAYRGWRRRWQTAGARAVSGALVWQLNDCWPCTSWSLVDSYLRVKPAYWAIKRELEPLVVGLERQGMVVTAWVVNGGGKTASLVVQVRAWSLAGELLGEVKRSLEVTANSVLELGQVANFPVSAVLEACLIGDSEQLSRRSVWPEPFKHLTPFDAELTLERLGKDTLRLQVKRPAKGVVLDAGDDVIWQENMLDLVPNREYLIRAVGLGQRSIQVTYLGADQPQVQHFAAGLGVLSTTDRVSAS